MKRLVTLLSSALVTTAGPALAHAAAQAPPPSQAVRLAAPAIRATATTPTINEGQRARFSGRVTGAKVTSVRVQQMLQKRRSQGDWAWRTVGHARLGPKGRFTWSKRIQNPITHEFRFVVPRTGDSRAVFSKVVKVRTFGWFAAVGRGPDHTWTADLDENERSTWTGAHPITVNGRRYPHAVRFKVPMFTPGDTPEFGSLSYSWKAPVRCVRAKGAVALSARPQAPREVIMTTPETAVGMMLWSADSVTPFTMDLPAKQRWSMRTRVIKNDRALPGLVHLVDLRFKCVAKRYID